MKFKRFSIFYLIVFLLTTYSCKQEMSSIKNGDSSVKGMNLSPHNEAVLSAVFSGDSNTLGAAERSGSITVSVNNGMLAVNSEEDLLALVSSLDAAVNNWDYSNSDQYIDTPDEIFHLGDEALNAFDESLGFNSLRSKYELLDFEDDEFRTYLEFYIADPDLKTVLNEEHEIQIGNKIYKYIDDHRVAVIDNLDFGALEMVRSFGIHAMGENLSFYNERTTTTDPAPIGTPAEPRGGCSLYLDLDVDEDSEDFRKVTADALLLEGEGGSTTACGFVSYLYDWGDGNTDSDIDGKHSHTYNVDIPVDECRDYTISVEALLVGDCGECSTGETKKASTKIKICNLQYDCNENNFTRTKKKEFTFNGKEFQIEGVIGQRTNTNIVNWNEKIWAETTFRKKKSNGKWKKDKPGNHITARAYGYFFTNECTTISAFQDKESSPVKKKSVKIKLNDIADLFGTRREGVSLMRGQFKASMEVGHEVALDFILAQQ